MDAICWSKIILSFIVGGISVTLCTTIAERFGSLVGGIVGGFPSTVVVSLLFIGLVDSADAASQATTLIPLIVGFNGLFLIAFYLLADRGFLLGMGMAITLWFVLSWLPWMLRMQRFDVAVVCYIICFAISCYLFKVAFDVRYYHSRKVVFTPPKLCFRAVSSGAIVALAVLLSQLVGPTLGGIFSVFPAVFISTLFIANFSRGVGFARSLTKPLMFSGMINVPVYAIAVRYLYPWAGITWGTVLSILIAVVNTYGTYCLSVFFYNKRQSVVMKEQIKVKVEWV